MEKVLVFMGVRGPAGASEDAAVAKLRELLEQDGAEPGSHEDVTSYGDGSWTMSFEVSESFYDRHEKAGEWYRSDGDWEADFEYP